MSQTYLRCPHVVDDQVVFVADDDIWSVALAGGAATRLTSDRAVVTRPRLSRDGRRVAWSSRRDGAPELYAMELDNGTPVRLTHWGHLQARVLGWTMQGQVVAATAWAQPFRSRSWAYAVPVTGEPGQRLPYGPLSGLARHPGGAVVVASAYNREPATWKRYRGGTAGRLWLDPDGSGEFRAFARELDGQLCDPVWVGDRVAFVSDHEGHGNVYSVAADGGDLRRHSDHTGMYARDLSGDLEGAGATIVYARAGRIHVLDSLAPDAQPRELDVRLPGARAARAPRPVTGVLDELSVDATGRASVAGVHGTIQWLTHSAGPVRALADADGVRTRLPRVRPRPDAPDPAAARDAVWVTDADGDDALELSDGQVVVRFAGGLIGRALELTVSPDGRWAAVASHDGRVLLVDLDARTVRQVDLSADGDSSGLAFSPDSAWLAYSQPVRTQRHIRIVAVDAAGAPFDATPVRFVDTEPVFTADGRYLAFLSARTFDPVYDAHNFELAFPTGVRPYLLSLAADTASPFDPELSGRAAEDPKPADAPAVPTVRIDPDGLADRISVMPVAAGLHSALTPARGGLLWLTRPVVGTIGADRPVDDKPRAALWRWDFAARKASTIVPALDWFAVSGDGTRIAVRDGEALRIGPSDRQVTDDDTGDVIEVDLGRVRVVSDPARSWRQMTVETWRLLRDHFWIEDMGGVDWPGVLDRYLPVVDRVATRDELSEVLWEMIGELGASHCYERPPVAPAPAGRAPSFLGVDYEAEGSTWRIARVLPGESSVPAARSPLLAAGADVRVGDVLVAVNGHGVGPVGPGPLLAGLADKPVELVISRDGAPRRVVVVPTADETPIRYQDWVDDRRRYVHDIGDGRMGYVHVPDMVSTGWAEFNRDLREELRFDSLVLDTRDNGGGHTSELVIERLSRKAIGGDRSRHWADESYPSTSPRGPLVSVTNEHAGSDGDIVNEAFREFGLGPIVGVRTWGGVIGIDGRYTLVDGTVVTQPRYSFWFRDAGWGVENYGVDPDVEVPTPPQTWVRGQDPQLDEGVRQLRSALETADILTPAPLSDRPDRSAPPLPPRP